MQDAFIEVLKVLGPTAAIAFIAFFYFDKSGQRQSEERKDWYGAQEKQADKVTKALENLTTALRKK